MPNFGEQATGSRKDDFEKAEVSLEEIKKTQAGELSLEELQALVAKRQELAGEKETIVEADHEEALGVEESRNVAVAEAAQAEQAKQEATRQAEEKATSEAADAAKAEALLAQIQGGEAPQAEVVEAVENGTATVIEKEESPSEGAVVIESGQKKNNIKIMNQGIHWGKIGVLVVAIAGIASIAFVAWKKSVEIPMPGFTVSENQVTPSPGDRVSPVMDVKPDAGQKGAEAEKTVRYENKKYGFSMDIPTTWTKIEENDFSNDSIEVNFSTEGGSESTTRLTLVVIPPETFNKIVRLCSLSIKYQYGASGAPKNELADAQLCTSLGYKSLADNFIARNKSYYFALGRWSTFADQDNTAEGVVDSFEILDHWIEWKKYRNEKYGFEFQYPDVFTPASPFETVGTFKTEDGDTYDSISIRFTTRDALFQGSYSPIDVDVYPLQSFQKKQRYCQSEVAQPLDCTRFPITDEENQDYGVQKNNKYSLYMNGAWWQDSAPIDWMTSTELDWTLDTFKVFDVK